MNRTTWRPGILATVLALALAIAGCSPRPGGPATGTPAAAKDSKPIMVGASISLSGSYAASARYALEGYQLWVDQANARGGVLGRPVQLVTYDDKSDPRTGAQLYEKLITQDQADLIVGPYSSAVTATVAAVAEKHKKVMLAPEASDTNIFSRGFKYSFQAQTTSDQYLVGALELAKQHGYKTSVILYEDTAFPKSVAEAVDKQAESYGLKILMSESYPKGASDFSALLVRAKQLNPDILLGGSYLPDSMGIMRQARELGFNAKLFAFTVGPSEAEFGTLGDTANLVFGATNWDKSLKTKGNHDFVAAYTQKFGREPDYHSAANYASLEVLEEAVKRVGSLDQDKLADAIRQLEMETVYGTFKVDENGAQTGYRAYLLQWQNGSPVLVWPEANAQGRYILPTPPWSERP